MNILEQKKEQILPYLYEWAETFNPENIIYNINDIDEEEENEMHNSYEYVLNLAVRLENNQCSDKDFEDILFHIEQINYNEVKIAI